MWLHMRILHELVKHPSVLQSKVCLSNLNVALRGLCREVYYWDSYWVIQGLIASNMMQTAMVSR